MIFQNRKSKLITKYVSEFFQDNEGIEDCSGGQKKNLHSFKYKQTSSTTVSRSPFFKFQDSMHSAVPQSKQRGQQGKNLESPSWDL